MSCTRSRGTKGKGGGRNGRVGGRDGQPPKDEHFGRLYTLSGMVQSNITQYSAKNAQPSKDDFHSHHAGRDGTLAASWQCGVELGSQMGARLGPRPRVTRLGWHCALVRLTWCPVVKRSEAKSSGVSQAKRSQAKKGLDGQPRKASG